MFIKIAPEEREKVIITYSNGNGGKAVLNVKMEQTNRDARNPPSAKLAVCVTKSISAKTPIISFRR